jgi:type IV secretory pathway VirB9-like protein
MKPAVRYPLMLVVCSSLAVGESAATKSPPKHAALKSATGADASDAVPQAKIIAYGEKDVIRLKTKLRYTTLIILPKEEQILDFTCGDKEFWVVNGNENIAYVKPAKAGAQTDLNLITASGNIYSFVLSEISEMPEASPDLKVFIQTRDESMISAANGSPKFVSTQALQDYREQAALAKEETRQVKQTAQSEIDRGIARYIGNMRFPYRFEAGKKPFYVRAMYNDDKFTYIQARPEETPALYEIQDGKLNLVNFEYRNGVYVVDKILDRGYLVIGKQKLAFAREE